MKRKVICVFTVLCSLATQIYGQTPEQLHSCLPVVDNWTLSPETEVFDSDNLYERINGAAPLFLENNFREMTSMIYAKGDDYITIQAYRHESPADAFGMYASERSPDMTFYPGIGGEAQGDDYGLFFFSGNIYVKMSANTTNEEVTKTYKTIAKAMSAKIDEKASYPAIFNSFPKDGLIPYTQAYITKNYIGHEFLKLVYTADYNLNGTRVQLFVIDGKTKDAAKQILSGYFVFTKQSQDFSEGNLTVEDRYNGNIPVVWRGQYIAGAFSSKGETFSESIYGFLNRFDR